MVRTQVQLTQEQAELLHRTSADRGVSIAALLREAVDLWARSGQVLSEQERRQRAIEGIGIIKSGPEDIASRHDDCFVESILQ